LVVQKLLLQEGVKRGLKASRDYSVSILGYDFIGLVSRLAIFYLVAFLVNSYMIASIKGGIWLNTIATLFGASLPQTLPQWLIDLFTVGLGSKGFAVSATPTAPGQFNPPGWDKPYDYGSIQHHQEENIEGKLIQAAGITITFWQIVQIISILLVVLEYFQYSKKLKEDETKPNVTTMAVFAMLGIGISLVTFPTMIHKIKEMRILRQ
tara:strand:+ start:31 stop:654 length:624 start_codon:yes stop_codon:yes gene_type:complete